MCGIREDAIQKRLLAEHDLNFAKAVQLAQSMETAPKNVKELQQPSGTPNTSTGAQESDSAQAREKGSPHLPSLFQDWPSSVTVYCQVSEVFPVWRGGSLTEGVQEQEQQRETA